MLSTTPIKNSQIDDPIAVVGRGNTATAHLLRRLTGAPVVELTPYEAAMAGDDTSRYQAVVVENFEPRDRRTLSPCAVARWELSRRAGVTVVALDDGEHPAPVPGLILETDEERREWEAGERRRQLRAQRRKENY